MNRTQDFNNLVYGAGPRCFDRTGVVGRSQRPRSQAGLSGMSSMRYSCPITPGPLTFCPFRGSANVDRNYARHANVYYPGCLDCENTLPMNLWAAAVLAKGASSQPRS